MMTSAGFAPGVGFAVAAASAFVAGSQAGASVGAGSMLRRCRVRQCGIVDFVPRVWAK